MSEKTSINWNILLLRTFLFILVFSFYTLQEETDAEEVIFTEEMCICANLEEIGWSGDLNGIVTGYPGNHLECKWYTKIGEDPWMGRPEWVPTAAGFEVREYTDAENAFEEYSRIVDLDKKDRNANQKIIEDVDTSNRYSSLRRFPDSENYTGLRLYSGERVIHLDYWVIAISGGGCNFKDDAEIIRLFDILEEHALSILGKKPEIEIEPNEGSPGSDVRITGEGFKPQEELELKWDDPAGLVLGRTIVNSSGQFVKKVSIPSDADEGTHKIFAVSTLGVRANASYNVKILYLHGYVKASLRGGLPLRGVRVQLLHKEPGRNITTLGVDSTDQSGYYKITSPRLSVPMNGSLLLRVWLEEESGIYEIRDDQANNSYITHAQFGEDGRIGATDDVSTWFTIKVPQDLEKDLWFIDTDNDPYTKEIREDHALDAALVYYHTHQAMRVYQEINAPFRTTPVMVVLFTPVEEGTFFVALPSLNKCMIQIDEDDSDWNSGNAPKNREWHEFSHYVMWDVYGQLPPRHREEDDFNGNGNIDKDINHFGYYYNWLSSSDAITEGFAEFMPMVISDKMNQWGEIYMLDSLEPYIYPSPYPYVQNLEINYPQCYIHDMPLELLQRVRERNYRYSDEELCVASTLWDLYDEVNPEEQDNVELSLAQIWEIFSRQYTFPCYYDGVTIQNYTGDDFTYAGRWDPKKGGFTGIRNLTANENYPTMQRNVWYIKDLYDALNVIFPELKREINEIFFSHEIYMNSYLVFEDYSTLEDDGVSTFGDVGSSIDFTISSEASYEFWGKGIVADLDVEGWGTGFSIEKNKLMDLRGYPYLLIWVNAPNGTIFDIVVEDNQGQWLCNGISSSIIEVDEPIVDLSIYQRGTGQWGAYVPSYSGGGPYPFVAVVSPSSSLEQYKLIYEFRPNTDYLSPDIGTVGPDLRNIKGIGVLFKTPGQYRAMVGAIVFVLDYPWEMGMKTMMGIGNPSFGSMRPYRRDLPPLNGSMVRVELSESPATIWVEMDYGYPYDGLGFSFPLNMTDRVEEFNLYVEPPFNGVENNVSIMAVKEGYNPSRSFEISSSQYWDNLGLDEYVVQIELDLERQADLRWYYLLAAIIILLLSLVLFTRRK